MDDKSKNIIIGVLAVIAVISLISLINNNLTGEAIKVPTGLLSVHPEVHHVPVEVYIDGEYVLTIATDKRLDNYKLKAGEYTLTARAEDKGDYVKAITMVSGEKTVVRPWTNDALQ